MHLLLRKLPLLRLVLTALAGCVLLSAPLRAQNDQDSSQQQQQGGSSSSSARAQDPAAHDSGSSDASSSALRDKVFLRKAIAGGLAEIQLGQLAAQQGGSDDVRQFAQRMVSDHTQLNDSLKPIAESLGIMLPTKMTSADQAHYNQLRSLSGEAFDRAYVKLMVDDHHHDLRDFRAEATSTQDASLREAAQKGSSVIRQHLTMISTLPNAKTQNFSATPTASASTTP